jgi:hypothetical protein
VVEVDWFSGSLKGFTMLEQLEIEVNKLDLPFRLNHVISIMTEDKKFPICQNEHGVIFMQKVWLFLF